MYTKIRNPVVTWLLTIFTGGIYALYWFWRVATELNHAEQKRVFNIVVWYKLYLLLFVLQIISFVINDNIYSTLFQAILFLTMLGLFIYAQLSIGNYISKKDKELDTGASYNHAVSLFLFWFVANTGIAYMQTAINRIIEHERARA